jgi:hypothetical protein
MARLESQRLAAGVTTPPNGTGAPDATPATRYCALCGRPASSGESAIERFGEAFCSEAHAEEFVQTVRAARVQAAGGIPHDAVRTVWIREARRTLARHTLIMRIIDPRTLGRTMGAHTRVWHLS